MGKSVAWLNLKCLDLQTHGVARLSFFYSCHIITFAQDVDFKKRRKVTVVNQRSLFTANFRSNSCTLY